MLVEEGEQAIIEYIYRAPQSWNSSVPHQQHEAFGAFLRSLESDRYHINIIP